jgi:glutamate/aspartate transport system substrate-binding protein
MRTRAFKGLIAGLAVSAVWPCSVLAEGGTLEKIRETGTITLGHRESSIPFSYYDDQQRVVGYSMDLCGKIVEAVMREVDRPDLEIVLNPVTPATRIPLMANGTVDLECGSTTNNIERQRQVAFTMTHFVTGLRFVSRKDAAFQSLEDLKGKTVTSNAGTTSIKLLNELNTSRGLGLTILPAKDLAEGFLLVETGRAQAFFNDDIVLYGLVANSRNPKDFVVSSEALSVEPYGIMLRRGDQTFKKVADDALRAVYQSGEIAAIYRKWFESPIPPRGITLAFPMSESLRKVIAHPTDSGDPAAY